MIESPCYFGIDGGGTFSRLALTDNSGNVLASSKAGSTNIYSVSKDEVYKNLASLFYSALKTAGIEKSNLAAGCIGSAGLGRNEEKIIFRGFFNKLFWEGFPVNLCTDAEILLCGALKNLEGYCLIAGTGSIAMGRNLKSDLVRSGGYGYMLGDEGSAAWIGKNAVVRILRSLEKRDLPTDMTDAILEAAGLASYDDLIRYVHHEAGKSKIAAIAPLVTAAARKNDPLALDILYCGAEELALLVKSVIDRSPGINNNELVLAGGVIEHDEIITGKLKEILAGQFPDLKISLPRGTALEGACMIAINNK